MESKMPKFGMMPLQTFKRLPNYYTYLQRLHADHVLYASAPSIAKAMGLNEVQVRKDLAAVSRNPGKPRKGFVLEELMDSIGECLGYHNREDAVLVGAGMLGKALLAYTGFEEHGVRIVAAFDNDENVVGTKAGGKNIFTISQLPSLCRRLNAHLAILTVPPQEAQAMCDMLVKNGILAIWNFAPVHLEVPKEVIVHNENMAAQLATLSQHLAEKLS